MIKFFKRFWNYLTAGANQKFNEKADPKIQLEQALTEAQDQHRRLKEHAANVIAQQKQTELQLNRAIEHLGKLNANARQAVTMADQAAKAGDAAKAAEYTRAAETIATQLVEVEAQVVVAPQREGGAVGAEGVVVASFELGALLESVVGAASAGEAASGAGAVRVAAVAPRGAGK